MVENCELRGRQRGAHRDVGENIQRLNRREKPREAGN